MHAHKRHKGSDKYPQKRQEKDLVGLFLPFSPHLGNKHAEGIGDGDKIGGDGEVEERSIFLGYAVADPDAVMVEGGHASMAVVAVFHS